MPCQLHCCTPEQADVDELLDERMLDESKLDEDERIDEDEERTDDGSGDEITLERTEDATELGAPQIAPVTTGVSTAPLVVTCIPKDAVCPGCTVPFQLRLVAE